MSHVSTVRCIWAKNRSGVNAEVTARARLQNSTFTNNERDIQTAGTVYIDTPAADLIFGDFSSDVVEPLSAASGFLDATAPTFAALMQVRYVVVVSHCACALHPMYCIAASMPREGPRAGC